jgi:hypothetical protein
MKHEMQKPSVEWRPSLNSTEDESAFEETKNEQKSNSGRRILDRTAKRAEHTNTFVTLHSAHITA